MENGVKKAVTAALVKFGEVNNYNASSFISKLLNVFDLEETFLEKVAKMDAVFDDEPAFEALREIIFDMLLVNFFTEDIKKLEEDYLDSEEWEAIEEETIDRGTELLNVLLYLRECQDEDIEPELEDYLKEFLLVDEDEFQDEHRIYEDVIANQILIESSAQEIAKVAGNLSDSSELKELFYPLINFFADPDPSSEDLETYIKYSKTPDFDAAVYVLLTHYNNA